MKPQLVPSQNIVAKPVIAIHKRESAVNRAPVLPAHNSNIGPVTALMPAKLTAPAPAQQQN